MEENIKEFEKIHKTENDLWSVIDKIYNSSEIQNLRLKGVVQNLGLELGFIVEQDKQMKKYKCERDKYKEILDKIKEEIDNLGALDCNIPNYMICITKINELLEEINE